MEVESSMIRLFKFDETVRTWGSPNLTGWGEFSDAGRDSLKKDLTGRVHFSFFFLFYFLPCFLFSFFPDFPPFSKKLMGVFAEERRKRRKEGRRVI